MSCSQQTPQPHARYCEECTKNGYPDQEIIILTTYGGRDTNIVNLDGSKHQHLFNRQKYEWDHYGRTT